MKKKNIFSKKLSVGKIIGIVILFFLVFSFGYLTHLSYSRMSTDIRHLSMAVSSTTAQLLEIKKTVLTVVQSHQKLSEQLASEKSERTETDLALINNKTEFHNELASLQSDITNQQKESTATDLTTVINKWSTRIARITCRFKEDNGDISDIRGSAVATFVGSDPYFLTNKHVVMADSGKEISSCDIYLPSSDTTYTITSDDLTLSDSLDIGYIKIGKNEKPFSNVTTSIPICADKPSVGDELVILGYPSVGSQSSVTATDGIISGFDDGYYVTSAKIEQGNSGGAAIETKNDCFLGIPTLVIVGKLESLARILPL